jgi:hypothetical protein
VLGHDVDQAEIPQPGVAELAGRDPRVDDSAGPRFAFGLEAPDLGILDREPRPEKYLGVRLEVLWRQVRRRGGGFRGYLHQVEAIRPRQPRLVTRVRFDRRFFGIIDAFQVSRLLKLPERVVQRLFRHPGLPGYLDRAQEMSNGSTTERVHQGRSASLT